MTVQEPDRVLYKRRKYELVAADGEGLFDPEQLHSELRPPHTACWSGYIATYVVKYGDLLLRDLECWIDPDSPPPSIGGHLPVAANEWGELAYRKLELPMLYTGRLALGGGEILGSFDYVPDLSIYELVHELRFENGRLVEAIDRSGKASRERSLEVWD